MDGGAHRRAHRTDSVRTGCAVHRVRGHQVLIAHRLQGVGGVRVLGVRDHVHREPDDAAGDARRAVTGEPRPPPVPQRGQTWMCEAAVSRAAERMQRSARADTPFRGGPGTRRDLRSARPRPQRPQRISADGRRQASSRRNEYRASVAAQECAHFSWPAVGPRLSVWIPPRHPVTSYEPNWEVDECAGSAVMRQTFHH